MEIFAFYQYWLSPMCIPQLDCICHSFIRLMRYNKFDTDAIVVCVVYLRVNKPIMFTWVRVWSPWYHLYHGVYHSISWISWAWRCIWRNSAKKAARTCPARLAGISSRLIIVLCLCTKCATRKNERRWPSWCASAACYLHVAARIPLNLPNTT